jgi:hypothetical protein
MVHGDLSVNNIVIYRTPLAHSPSNPSSRKGAKEPSVRMTRASLAMAQAAITPAPAEGLREDIPVTGIVIDYDYAREVGTAMEKTSVGPRHSLNCSVLILISFLLTLGYLAFHAACLSGQRKSWQICPQSHS